MNMETNERAKPSAIESRTIRKICWRLVPFIALMFFINFLDRTAISFAGPNGMTQDLGMTAAQFGFASGIFFIGYIFLEVPSNLALQKFGARIWLARIMITWGIVAVLFTWVSSISGLYWLRFLLGIAEAGFFPGAILYLSTWVPSSQRTKILSLFYLSQPLTTVIGAPLASLLIEAHGLFGLEGWRIMFFGVGAPAIIVGVAALFYLPNSSKDAHWLTDEERNWLDGQLKAESKSKSHDPKSHRVRSALTNGRVWLLSAIYFGMVYGLYALAFFLPTVIAGFETKFGTKFDVFEKGLIIAIPYLAAAIALYFWSADATKRGVRAWHIGIPALTGAISVPVALLMNSPETTIAVVTITACSIFCVLPTFWALPSRFLSGAGAAAGIALINSIGNAAGFAAPYVTGAVKDVTGGYEIPMYIVGAVMILSSIMAFSIGPKIRPQMEVVKI
ncbi:MFS transporter [Mesorhizobium retamae]|uniref:MFS transporter n=1 Tax=Mesorhizobium retamae TaxID=2912854 RepID=A0ABS9QFF2_9HYPH|nr:MFS transporter [Mesorhizobium sp. IRAMC:0171]MCG7505364.1 MFS transporter [Mesorhizobium sp. IRAMC:0171]